MNWFFCVTTRSRSSTGSRLVAKAITYLCGSGEHEADQAKSRWYKGMAFASLLNIIIVSNILFI
jgi:hypothetical protein